MSLTLDDIRELLRVQTLRMPGACRLVAERPSGSTASKRVTAHVKAGRSASEIKNPQGSCCLGNLGLAERRCRARLAGVDRDHGMLALATQGGSRTAR